MGGGPSNGAGVSLATNARTTFIVSVVGRVTDVGRIKKRCLTLTSGNAQHRHIPIFISGVFVTVFVV